MRQGRIWAIIPGMTEQPKELPPHYAKLAWNPGRKAGDEPSKKLNTRKVVQGAIELADKEGLDNLTIRRLSEQLGFTTMAVYRHIVSREELLILMRDMALGEPPASIRQAPTWQEAVRRWAAEVFTRYQRHPWALDLPGNGMPTMPNQIAWLECILETLKPCKITLQQKLDAALLIDGHVRNFVNLGRPDKSCQTEAAAGPNSGWLRSLIDARSYPNFWQVLQEGVLEDEEGPELAFGLECIIKGLEASL